MTSGDQLRPYEPPYMRFWREGLSAAQVAKGLKHLKLKSRKKAKKAKAKK